MPHFDQRLPTLKSFTGFAPLPIWCHCTRIHRYSTHNFYINLASARIAKNSSEAFGIPVLGIQTNEIYISGLRLKSKRNAEKKRKNKDQSPADSQTARPMYTWTHVYERTANGSGSNTRNTFQVKNTAPRLEGLCRRRSVALVRLAVEKKKRSWSNLRLTMACYFRDKRNTKELCVTNVHIKQTRSDFALRITSASSTTAEQWHNVDPRKRRE